MTVERLRAALEQIAEPLCDAAFRSRLLRQGLSTREMAEFVDAVEGLQTVAREALAATAAQPEEAPGFAEGEREALERMFSPAACRRLGRSEYDYYSTHGEYVPPLARLLNATRAERDAAAVSRAGGASGDKL